ncbi:hypothetical protein Tco_1163350 [Tanacetum coccineum]
MSLSLVENVIVFRDDNHPSMLDKKNYSSWASRMLLYIKGKEHGKLLFDSVLNGPFQYGTIVEPGNETTPATVRARTYTDLTDEEKIHESVDIKATNIVLQGSELSLQERESKLYDDFDTFTSTHGETIHSYYMQFAQLINDMHTIGMTMKPLQVNTKFVNHLLPEWSKVVTDVKLAKDMHTTNFDHLYAYLRKHKAHANEVRLQRQRYPDQIALVSNSPSSPAIQQSSSIELDLGLVVLSFNPSDDPIANLNKLMAFQAFKMEESPYSQFRGDRHKCMLIMGQGTLLQIKLLKDNGDTIFPTQASQEIPSSAAFQTDDLDAFDSDCDDAPSAKEVLMANLSSFDSDVLSEAPFHDTNIENDMSYKSAQETQCYKQPFFDNDIEIDITSDSNIIPYEQYLQETENSVVQHTSSSVQQDELLMSVTEEMSSRVAKCNKVQQENLIVNETLTAELEYKEQTHDALSVTDTEETLELVEESRLKMLAKQNDPSLKEKKVNISPIDYVALNKLSEHFVKNFVPKKQLPAEQENDHLFELLFSQDIVHICVNSLATLTNYAKIEQDYIDEYRENLMLKAELAKKEHMVEKRIFDEVVLRCSRLENRCANLELKLQHKKESFLNNRSFNNQNAHAIHEFFKINEWQAKLDAKDVSIANLRKHIKSLKGKNVVEKDVTPNNANVIAP